MIGVGRAMLRRVPFAVAAYRYARRRRREHEFAADFREFRRLSQQARGRFSLRWADRYPCLDDQTSTTGFDRHYVFHTAWAARMVAELRPSVHVDISSSLYFSALVSAFVPVQFYDYRPANLGLDGLQSGEADLTALHFASDSVSSLSCMHVVEHIGLGRYGDPLDPDGDTKAMRELARVLAPGGVLLFVVPVGQPRIMFNAHRIYAYDQVVQHFAGLSLEEFSLVADDVVGGGLLRDATREMANAQHYGCGCFLFRKPKP